MLDIFIFLIVVIVSVIYFTNARNSAKIEHKPLKIPEEARAIVLSCIDFRTVPSMRAYLDTSGYALGYDKFSLAGASLHYLDNQVWREVTDEHISLAIDLHHIKEVVILEHMDCGAYKIFYGDGGPLPNEQKYHEENMKSIKAMLEKSFPQLKVSGALLTFSGEVLFHL